MNAFVIAKRDHVELDTPVFHAGSRYDKEAVAVFTNSHAAGGYIRAANWTDDYEVGVLNETHLLRWLMRAQDAGVHYLAVNLSRATQESGRRQNVVLIDQKIRNLAHRLHCDLLASATRQHDAVVNDRGNLSDSILSGESLMSNTSVKKVNADSAPRGKMGQKYLASGVRVAMRLWEEEPTGTSTESSERDYETVGFVLNGRAQLQLDGQELLLEPGDCWVVPRGARHSYRILETFSAIEATSPPARVHARDESPTGLG